MKLLTYVFLIAFLSCKKQEVDNPNIGLAELTCYAGDKIFYQVTTKAYKIHNESEGEKDEKWEIDTDQGKVIVSGTCIYKQLNY